MDFDDIGVLAVGFAVLVCVALGIYFVGCAPHHKARTTSAQTEATAAPTPPVAEAPAPETPPAPEAKPAKLIAQYECPEDSDYFSVVEIDGHQYLLWTDGDRSGIVHSVSCPAMHYSGGVR